MSVRISSLLRFPGFETWRKIGRGLPKKKIFGSFFVFSPIFAGPSILSGNDGRSKIQSIRANFTIPHLLIYFMKLATMPFPGFFRCQENRTLDTLIPCFHFLVHPFKCTRLMPSFFTIVTIPCVPGSSSSSSSAPSQHHSMAMQAAAYAANSQQYQQYYGSNATTASAAGTAASSTYA